MLNRRYIIYAFLAFLFLAEGVLSCSRGKKPGSIIAENEVIPEDIVEMRDDQIRLAEIDTGKIEMRKLNGHLKVNGIVTVAPQNQATICAPMGGFVKSTTLIPGNVVSRGQTLAVIENQEFVDIQQSYLEAKSRLVFAEAEYNRHTDLYKQNVYSEQNLQQVTAEYKSLKAQVTALEQKLGILGINPAGLNEDNISRSINLVAPISGFVKSVNVNVGKYVTAFDIMFEIINNDNLLLELTLFEKDANRAVRGGHIKFYINNEEEQHDAVIIQTGKSVNVDKTYKVYATVTGKCENVLPGMYVNAIIETSSAVVSAMPDEAVVSFDDKDYIFVFERNKEEGGKPFTEYRIIEVHKGISEGGYTHIILPDNFDPKKATVVIKGAYNLLAAKKNAGEMAC
jgi:cobalt-zinc-cadmium efflux system membrane fusion protein